MFKFFLFIMLTLWSIFGFSQNLNHRNALKQLSQFNEVELALSRIEFQSISRLRKFDVSRVILDSVYINIDKDDFDFIDERKLSFRTIEREILIEQPKFSSSKAYLLSDFNTYPTYYQYDSIMIAFANSYPSIAKLVNLGTLPSGRKIYALRISKNVNINEPEPKVLLTSSIHGDELTGYILLLKLSKYFLEGYGVDAEITAIIDSTDLWINPLANPDGTYFGGNNTVSLAVRRNANNVDLNRNYPDPEDGPHPDGKAYQSETMIFMALADTVSFDLSANFHGGAEVINYPWDTWPRLHADKGWWEFVSHLYADSCHKASNFNGYLATSSFPSGVTNGYAWYSIDGGRQDFMNYFHHCREVTMEISMVKLLPENQLNTFWNYNKRALIDYVKNAQYGLRGFVLDSSTNMPVSAKLFVINHDLDSSFVYSSAAHGDYFRFLDSGYYSLLFTAPGYYSKQFDSIRIDRFSPTYLNVSLVPKPTSVADFEIDNNSVVVFPNPANDFISIILPVNNDKTLVSIFDAHGKLMFEKWISPKSGIANISVKQLTDGFYFVGISNSCSEKPRFSKMLIKR